MSFVRFNYADVAPIPVGRKQVLKKFVAGIFKVEGKALKLVNYVFCSDEYLLNINQSFLQHDYYTDIISFDLSVSNEIIGEVYVSVDRVKENSTMHAEKFQNELLRVIFHGALHLCGYRDKKKSEITIMRQKEEYYLRLWKQKDV